MAKCMFICPPEMTSLSRVSDAHLILQQFVIEGSRYANYFHRRITDYNDYVILDNGVAEGLDAPSLGNLLDKADLVGAQEMVMPDVMFDLYATVDRTSHAIVDLYELRPESESRPKIHVVVQGEDFGLKASCFNYFAGLSQVDIISFNESRRGDVPRRCEVIKLLHARGYLQTALSRGKKIHYLGRGIEWREDAKVAHEYIGEGLRSIDTTFAAKAAMRGCTLDEADSKYRGPKSTHGFFSTAGMPDDAFALYEKNVKIWKEVWKDDGGPLK